MPSREMEEFAVQSHLTRILLYNVLKAFETKWRSNPTPIELPRYICKGKVEVRGI